LSSKICSLTLLNKIVNCFTDCDGANENSYFPAITTKIGSWNIAIIDTGVSISAI